LWILARQLWGRHYTKLRSDYEIPQHSIGVSVTPNALIATASLVLFIGGMSRLSFIQSAEDIRVHLFAQATAGEVIGSNQK
jgi:hypothetical protein